MPTPLTLEELIARRARHRALIEERRRALLVQLFALLF
jgi:hypothetical protein